MKWSNKFVRLEFMQWLPNAKDVILRRNFLHKKDLTLGLDLLYACLNLETLLSWCFLSLLHLKLENESDKPIVEAVINRKRQTLSTKMSRVRRSVSTI